MRHVFIVNKFSLNKRLDTISEKIKEVCQELQIDYVIEKISKDNLMKDALKKIFRYAKYNHSCTEEMEQ